MNLDRAKEAVSALGKHGSILRAAASVGITRSAFRARLKTAKKAGIYDGELNQPTPRTESGKDFIAPPGDALDWCEETRRGWKRHGHDHTETRTIFVKGRALCCDTIVYDPGTVYPADWTGPFLGDKPRQPPALRKGIRGFVFTAAQDKTPAHGPFAVNLEAFCRYNGYDLHVGPLTYNRDWFMSMFGASSDPRQAKRAVEIAHYSSAIQKWISRDRVQVAHKLVWHGNMNVSPTAVSPLSGLATIGKSRSVIFPHTKQGFEMIPRSQDDPDPLWAATTGSITGSNYIAKKAGLKAEFHHVYGALLVEIDADGHIYPTQIHADPDDGSFHVYDCLVERGRLTFGHRIPGLVAGDIHIEKACPAVLSATFSGTRDDTSLYDTLKPKQLYIHDLIDFSSRNHHNIHDPHFRARFKSERIADEHAKAGTFLSELKRTWSRVIVVQSNHDLAFMRWLKESDWRDDITNAELYLSANRAVIRAIEAGKRIYALEWSVARVSSSLSHVTWMHGPDQKSVCEGVECHYHGHRGTGGSRGSTRNLARLARKVAKGHDHSPTLLEGVGSTGHCLKLPVDYTEGTPTTWAHAHLLIYPKGKMGLCFVHDGRWRALGKKRSAKSRRPHNAIL